MPKPIIGVMGPGDSATATNLENATELGRLIAKNNWNLLTGGRGLGVMDAASKGAKQAGGLVIGILPSSDKTGASEYLDVPICTGMGSARNNINVLSSDVVVAVSTGAGTTSEIMLALKAQQPLILLRPQKSLLNFLYELSYPTPAIASSPEEAIPMIAKFL